MKADYRFVIGKSENRDVTCQLTDFKSVLIGGATASGKSYFLHKVIRSIVRNTSADDIGMILVDPKSVEFSEYAGDEHLIVPIVYDCETAVSVLNEVGETKEATKEVFVIVDEYTDWSGTAEFRDAVMKAANGSSDRIHILVAVQYVDAEVLTRDFLDSFETTVALRVFDEIASRLLVGDSGAEKLSGSGDAILRLKKTNEPMHLKILS